MSALYYRLPTLFAATVSLALSACAGKPPPPAASQTHAGPLERTASNTREIDTDATIWTVLGLSKERHVSANGPTIGAEVSPILWQAAHDTLNFVKVDSEDPIVGRMLTRWYSPPDKPNERFRVGVFILARTLRSDAIAVRVERQNRSESGEWTDASIDRKVDDDLTFTILNRAREIRQILAAKYE